MNPRLNPTKHSFLQSIWTIYTVFCWLYAIYTIVMLPVNLVKDYRQIKQWDKENPLV